MAGVTATVTLQVPLGGEVGPLLAHHSDGQLVKPACDHAMCGRAHRMVGRRTRPLTTMPVRGTGLPIM